MVVYRSPGHLSDEDDSLAARKTKQLIARTYGKQRKKKNKLKSIVYGSYFEETGSADDVQYSALTQFAVSSLVDLFIWFTY